MSRPVPPDNSDLNFPPPHPQLDGSGLILGRKMQPRSKAPMGFTASMRQTTPDTAASGLIRYPGDSHLLTFGSTGSGKTTGPAICNALTHPGQLIVMECKGDVMDATIERRRKMGQQVHVLDFRGEHPDSGSFNPLDAVRISGRWQQCHRPIAGSGRGQSAQRLPRSVLG